MVALRWLAWTAFASAAPDPGGRRMTTNQGIRTPAGEAPGIVPSGSGPGRFAVAVRATRPLYLLTSLIPGLIGVAVAIGADDAQWWAAPVAMVALLCVHAGANMINDVEDFARGVDAVDNTADRSHGDPVADP